MNEILDETVAEAMYEKKVDIFKKALFIAVIIGFIIIVSLSLYSSRESKIANLNSEVSNLLFQSINNPDNQEYINKLLNKIKGQDTTTTNLAKLYLFGLDIKGKNFSNAVVILHEIIASTNAGKIIKNYAKINLVSISLDRPDLVPASYIEKYITEIDIKSLPLARNGQIIKSLYLIKQSKLDEAANILKEISQDPDVSREIQLQAKAIIASYIE
jgi:predicted negative regulator of RcsB-dependent stress response